MSTSTRIRRLPTPARHSSRQRLRRRMPRTSNSLNQLTVVGANTLAYDNNGNLATDDSGYTLKYDAWNRLVSAKNGTLTLVSFAYDGQGWRTQESKQ